jgi:hypothetical protein
VENIDYIRQLESPADSAQYESNGLYAAPCGKPQVWGDEDGNGVANADERADVDAQREPAQWG